MSSKSSSKKEKSQSENNRGEIRRAKRRSQKTSGLSSTERFEMSSQKIPPYQREKYYEKSTFKEKVKEQWKEMKKPVGSMFQIGRHVTQEEFKTLYDQTDALLVQLDRLMLDLGNELLEIKRGIHERFKETEQTMLIKDLYNLYDDVDQSQLELKAEIANIREEYDQLKDPVRLPLNLMSRLQRVLKKAQKDENTLKVIEHNKETLMREMPDSESQMNFPEETQYLKSVKKRVTRLRTGVQQREQRDLRRIEKLKPEGYVDQKEVDDYETEAKKVLNDIEKYIYLCKKQVQQLENINEPKTSWRSGLSSDLQQQPVNAVSPENKEKIKRFQELIKDADDAKKEISETLFGFEIAVEDFFGVPPYKLKSANEKLEETKELIERINDTLMADDSDDSTI